MGSGADGKAGAVRFGPFELDLDAGQLRKHGTTIRLQEQPLKLLLCLLEKPGSVVSREELARRIWSDGTFVDFEHGLNAAATRLRWVLRDSAENPRYIETVARKGYRFIAPLTELPAPEASGVRQAAGLEEQTPPRRRQWLRIVLGGAAVVAIGLLALTSVLFRSTEPPPIYSAEPLTSYPGSEICPSFSPDGERVAFAWDGEKEDNFDIYIKQIGVTAPSRLTTDPRTDVSPAWSPDGRNIAFVRFSDSGKAELMVTPSLGSGPERRLGELMTPLMREQWRLRLLAWSPDSKWLVVSDGSSEFAPRGLFLLSVETGEKRRLTQSSRFDDLEPAFSPDMKHIAFTRFSGSIASNLHILDLSETLYPLGEPRRLIFDPGQTRTPVWISNGKALVFVQQRGAGGPALWQMVLGDHPTAHPMTLPAENASGVAVSPKGNRLVYSRATINSNIWAFESSGPRLFEAQKLSQQRWIATSYEEVTPSFSPDGSQIAVQSSRSGWREIWIHDRDGSHARQLTDLKALVAGFPHWSPDGKKVAFHSRWPTEAAIYVVDVAGGRPQRLTSEPVNEEITPSWSRDGKWIYFSSRKSGVYQIWKVPSQGGTKTQITQHEGEMPSDSADGKYLYYVRLRSDSSIWRIPVSGGEERPLPGVAVENYDYALGSSGIYFISVATGNTKQQLAFYSFKTGKIKALADVPRPVDLGIAVSPDEHLLLYTQVDRSESDLMLVENFRTQ